MRLTLLVGTTNPGKLVEIRRILSGLDLDLRPSADFEQAPEVVEDGLTYRDNAVKKAQTIAAWSGQLTLADDSGLEVVALGGRAGCLYGTIWWSGLSARERCLAICWSSLHGVPDSRRQAVFRCVVVLMEPDWAHDRAVRGGQCRGVIGHALRGEGGFGYDPTLLVAGAWMHLRGVVAGAEGRQQPPRPGAASHDSAAHRLARVVSWGLKNEPCGFCARCARTSVLFM